MMADRARDASMRRSVVAVAFGDVSCASARRAVDACACAGDSARARVVRVRCGRTAARAEGEAETAWRGDVARRDVARALVDALVKANALGEVGDVVVACAGGVGTETTRAVQTWLALREALPSGTRAGVWLEGDVVAPTKESCLRQNLCFNAVTARCPARYAHPRRREEEGRAAWRAFHVRAIRRAVGPGERFEDDGDVVLAVVSGGGRRLGRGHPIQRLALTMTEQLEDASETVRAFVAERAARAPYRELRDGERARLVESSPERWVSGGYAEHHYVRAAPGPHGVYYELELESTSERVAYVALSCLQSDETATASYPFASPDSIFTTAQVDRLCVLPAHRRRGAKEALLRDACDGFHRALGVAVRVKTAKESVVKSFQSCELLAFERVKDPTANGVSKSRGAKVVVVLPSLDRVGEKVAERWRDAEDDERDYDADWRAVAAERNGRDKREGEGAGVKKKGNALADFNAALNRVTPDNVQRVSSQMISALDGAESFDAHAERLFAAATRGQSNYAAAYAECCAAMPEDFRRVVRDHATRAMRRPDADLRDVAEFFIELWVRGVVAEDELVEALFERHPSEDFERTEIALRFLARFGDRSVGSRDAARAYLCACEPSGREELERAGAPKRLIFLAEELHDFASSGFARARADSRRRAFGERARASSRAEAVAEAVADVKNLRIAYEDDEEIAAAMRGERKGWIFWYCGSPVLAHDGSEYAFAPGEGGERFVRVGT